MYPNNNIKERQEIMNLSSPIDSQAKISFIITCGSVNEQIKSQDDLIITQNHQQEILTNEIT